MKKYISLWQYRRPFTALTSVLCLAILFLLPLHMNTEATSPDTQAAVPASQTNTPIPQILRFHILANSDSPEDQALKLEVRTILLEKIYDDIQKEDSVSLKAGTLFSGISQTPSKARLQTYIAEHAGELEAAAESFMEHQGFSYPAKVELTQCYFPTREYAGRTFPAGTYDAVRILLGEAEGHNWWCVLYPPLAFSGGCAVEEVPDAPAAQGSEKNDTITVNVRLKSFEWLRRSLYGSKSTHSPFQP